MPTLPYNTNDLLAKAKTMSGELQGAIDRGQGSTDITKLSGDTQLADIGKPIGSFLTTTDLGETYDPTGGDMTQSEIDKTRNDVLAQYQGEINASKDAYARLLAEQQQQGIGRLGESTATQARRGLIGSSFGTGMTEDVRKTNLNAEGKVLESQASALANIMARVNQQAQQEIADKRAAKKGGYEATVAYNRELPTKRKAYAAEIADNLLSQGLDYSALSSAEMKQLQGLGINQQDIISAYLSKKKANDEAEAEKAQKGEFTLTEGGARYDAAGNIIASRAKTYEPTSTEDYGGYSKVQATKIASIDDKVSKNATYVKTSNMRGYADNVVASLSQGTGTGDLAAINQFQKVIDEGAVTRDQDVKLIQDSQSLYNKIATQVNKLKAGQQLSPELRSEMKKSVETLYQKQIEALAKDPFVKAKTSELSRYGIDPKDTIIGELGAYSQDENTTDPQVQELLDQGYTQEQIDQLINS